jgi:MFS family permease
MRSRTAGIEAPLAPRVKGIVLALAASSFVQWVGASALLPLLPLFLRQHGSSDTMVGATMAAFFAFAFLTQYPAGRLSDRIGRRPLQLGGLAIYALASVGFAFVSVPWVALVLRGLQGAGSGVALVASAAVIGETVPDHWRGRAYGLFYGSSTAGLAIGPLVGSILGAASMRPLFLTAAACATAACVPLALLVPRGRPDAPVAAAERGGLLRRRAVIGVVVAAAAAGLLTGTYEVCWSLLLHLRGARNWQIGLSWTLFAVPFVAVSVPGGWLVDHLDRRYLTGIAMLVSAGFACTYPFVHDVSWLIGIVGIEATTMALGAPAMLSQLSATVATGELGRAQGLVSSSQTAATAVAATVAGSLFAAGPAIPFVATGLAVALCAAALPLFWRGVPGRTALPEGANLEGVPPASLLAPDAA